MENEIIELIARDRLEIPLSSMYQRLKRMKKTDAEGLVERLKICSFEGKRVRAHLAYEDKERARGMKEAVAEFSLEFPKYGTILQGMIAEKRIQSEEHVYFGMREDCRLTADDYMGVMTSLGLSEGSARSLYPDLMDISRKLKRARQEGARSVIVGKYAESEG